MAYSTHVTIGDPWDDTFETTRYAQDFKGSRGEAVASKADRAEMVQKLRSNTYQIGDGSEGTFGLTSRDYQAYSTEELIDASTIHRSDFQRGHIDFGPADAGSLQPMSREYGSTVTGALPPKPIDHQLYQDHVRLGDGHGRFETTAQSEFVQPGKVPPPSRTAVLAHGRSQIHLGDDRRYQPDAFETTSGAELRRYSEAELAQASGSAAVSHGMLQATHLHIGDEGASDASHFETMAQREFVQHDLAEARNVLGDPRTFASQLEFRGHLMTSEMHSSTHGDYQAYSEAALKEARRAKAATDAYQSTVRVGEDHALPGSYATTVGDAFPIHDAVEAQVARGAPVDGSVLYASHIRVGDPRDPLPLPTSSDAFVAPTADQMASCRPDASVSTAKLQASHIDMNDSKDYFHTTSKEEFQLREASRDPREIAAQERLARRIKSTSIQLGDDRQGRITTTSHEEFAPKSHREACSKPVRTSMELRMSSFKVGDDTHETPSSWQSSKQADWL